MKKIVSLLLIALTLLSMPFSAGAATAFSDVPANTWYTEAVYWANEQELMKGVSASQFDPRGTVTRAQLVTILWRMEGEPAAQAAPFTDVRAGSWYETAVAWAYSHGIVTGTGNGATFNPGGKLSRAQAAAIFYRYSDSFHGYNTLKAANLTGYPDYSAVAGYAQKPMAWANAEGLITGSQEGGAVYLRPTGTTTRAQLAVILQRYIRYVHTQSSLHSMIKTTQRFHYLLLNEKLQDYYRKLNAGVEHLDDMVFLGTEPLTLEEINLLFTCYTEDNPEHFYLDLGYAVYTETTPEKTSYYLNLYYTDGTKSSNGTLTPEMRARIQQKKKLFDDKVHAIIDSIHVGMPQVEKEKAIHDWIITHNYYSLDALQNYTGAYLPDEYTAYGAIIGGSGVCEAYSTAFQVLCHAMGIHCTSVEGIADGQRHRWNAVQLDGEWYVVDATFDDPLFQRPDGSLFDGPVAGQPISDDHYRYFNRTCGGLKNSHTPDQPLYHPASTGTKYSYENYFKK